MMKAKIEERLVNGRVKSYGKINDHFDGSLVWFVSEDNTQHLLHPSSLKEEAEDEDFLNGEQISMGSV